MWGGREWLRCPSGGEVKPKERGALLLAYLRPGGAPGMLGGVGKHTFTLRGNSSKGWGWSPGVFQMPVSICLCRLNTQPLPLPLGRGQIFNDCPCFHTLHMAATAFSRCLLPGRVTEVSVLS